MLIMILEFYWLSNILYSQLLINSKFCQLLTSIYQHLCTAQQVKFQSILDLRLPMLSLRYCLLLKS